MLVLAAVLSNVLALRDGAASLRAQAQQTVTELGALDIARGFVSPSYVSQGFLFNTLDVRDYFAAEDALGTPAATPAQIADESDGLRAAADNQLIAIHNVALTPAPAATPSGQAAAAHVDDASGGSVAVLGPRSSTESARHPAGATNALDLTVPSRGWIHRRGRARDDRTAALCDSFEPLGTLAGEAALLRIGPDRAAQPWHVRIAPAAGARACSAG